jgi:NAD(P)-dependent dehydrogenase (short-subunit alcohol dehydrogenase family)
MQSPSSRIVIVSSASFREVEDPLVFERDLLAGSNTPGRQLYAETKFVQLLGAHWWRRKLQGTSCTVVAVSPGLVPATNIGKGMGVNFTMDWPGARTIDAGEFRSI